MPGQAEWTQQAIAWMKQGHPPEAVHAHLLGLGASDAQARALVEHLLALKRQAEASDPQRLSAEAAAMIAQRAPFEHVLHHLTSRGIAEQHARAEIERLVALHQRSVAAMRACDRCGTPMAPADSYFDRLGNQVCRRCNRQDEVGAAEMRVEEAQLEAAGVSPWQIQENQKIVFCPRCQDHTGVLREATHFVRSGIALRTYQCTRCGQML